ncbi:MAG: transposase [Planctomycetes bacterium]|nr:transposase [Planctomycetota bacterium]
MNATKHRVRIVTVHEFAERFGTDRQCAEHLARPRWQKGSACPACGHAGSGFVATRRLPRKESGDGLSLGSHRRLEPRAVHPGPASCHRGQTRGPPPRGVRLSTRPPPRKATSSPCSSTPARRSKQ